MLQSRHRRAVPDKAYPSDFSSRLLELDANDLRYTYAAGAAITGNWTSRVGGYNFAQATGTKQPLFKMDTGAPSVWFDGVDDLMVYAGNISTATSGTFFLVYRAETTSSLVPFATSDEADTIRYWRIIRGANPLIQCNDATGVDGIGMTPATALLNLTVVLTLSSSGTAWSMDLHGAGPRNIAVSGGTNSGDWWGDVAARDNVTVGALKHTSENLHYLGHVYAASLFSAQLDSRERAAIAQGYAERFNCYVNP